MRYKEIRKRSGKSIEMRDGLWVKEEIEISVEVEKGDDVEAVKRELEEEVKDMVAKSINEAIEELTE